jgi:hypothetical protein
MIITENTTLKELEAELAKRGVADLNARLNQKPDVGGTAGAVLHALRGPSGRAHSSIHAGPTLAHALDKLCRDLDEQAEAQVCVRDHLGRLRGRYDNTPEGRKHAEAHMRSLGKGASVSK